MSILTAGSVLFDPDGEKVLLTIYCVVLDHYKLL